MPGAKPEAAPPPPEPHGPPPGRGSEDSLGAKGLHGSDGDGVLAFAASREASVVEVHDLALTLTLTLPLPLSRRRRHPWTSARAWQRGACPRSMASTTPLTLTLTLTLTGQAP